MSREKATMLDKPITSVASNGSININSSSNTIKHVPLNSFSNNVIKECTKIQVINDSCMAMAVQEETQSTFLAENVNKKISGGNTSCSLQDVTIVGADMEDKRFMDNIFSLLRKEETFEGQMKLIEWVLQINNPSVLCWYVNLTSLCHFGFQFLSIMLLITCNFFCFYHVRFLTKGGVTILSTWLSQAASEEQTSVILVIFKVYFLT